jgi:hypothetical protein
MAFFVPVAISCPWLEHLADELQSAFPDTRFNL